MKQISEKQKKIGILGAMALAVIFIVVMILAAAGSGEEEAPDTKEEGKANSVKSVTETGSVEVGTTVQSFDLDISEFTGSSSFSFPMGDMAGNNGMGMMTGQSQTENTAERQLEIEEVYIEAGQEVEEGTPILKLTEETVARIRNDLSQDVTDAELVYHQALTAEKQSQVSAESTYQTNSLYESYAQAEYDQTVAALTEAVATAQEELAEIQENLAQAQEELSEKETLLTEEKQVLANALFTEEGTDKETALYWWIIAYQTAEDAGEMVSTLEEEIQQLKEDIENYTKEAAEKETALALAQEALESGEISAKGELDKRNYNAQNAQEIYDVAIEQSAFETESAKKDYEEAKKKLEEFDSVITDQIICAAASGVITEVYVAEGDYLTQNMDLISLNNYDEITITVSVEEGDMDAAALGNPVNITVAAFGEQVFTGTVTEIGDAEIDSNTNKTLYSVTVTVENMGSLMYQDMTAEVTFVADK